MFDGWFFLLVILALVLAAPFSWYGGKLLDEDIKAGRTKSSSLYAISNFAKYDALKRRADQGDRLAYWALLLAGVVLLMVTLIVLAAFSSPIWSKW